MRYSFIYLAVKRSLDVIVSALALLVLCPLLVAIGIAIRLESKGPTLFTHTRIGKDGEPFHMHKFRSMIQNAANLGPYWTADNDSRITQIGKFLRRTSLDELPQLLNVLKGDMSLIGPRPDTSEQEHRYTPRYWAIRHCIKPGITGLAQVNGRSDITFRRRVACDIYYSKHASIFLDIFIIIRTIRILLTRQGTN